MDVRTRFHMPFRDYGERTCVIVVNIHENFVGLVVEPVKEVTNMPEEGFPCGRKSLSFYLEKIVGSEALAVFQARNSF